jgi:hypothetical protein
MLEFADAALARFDNASLRDSLLISANFDGAKLAGADLTGASVGRTVLTNCGDLDRALGLASVSHLAPSAIDVVTFARLRPSLPAAFVTGIGLDL